MHMALVLLCRCSQILCLSGLVVIKVITQQTMSFMIVQRCTIMYLAKEVAEGFVISPLDPLLCRSAFQSFWCSRLIGFAWMIVVGIAEELCLMIKDLCYVTLKSWILPKISVTRTWMHAVYWFSTPVKGVVCKNCSQHAYAHYNLAGLYATHA